MALECCGPKPNQKTQPFLVLGMFEFLPLGHDIEVQLFNHQRCGYHMALNGHHGAPQIPKFTTPFFFSPL